MTDTAPLPPESLHDLVERLAGADRSAALCLHALVQRADAGGSASLYDVGLAYREDHLAAIRAEGRDAETEAGRLSMDDVRSHLVQVVLPRLASVGAIVLPEGLGDSQARVQLGPELMPHLTAAPEALGQELQQTGEHRSRIKRVSRPAVMLAHPSVLAAEGLVKTYRRRNVVNDVKLELRQGEIVGLLGPNGAGKTTTFYMITGLIPPASGRILLDGEDITRMPMYQRARRGIGYLSQEPSVFRKLTVEENILAILETLPLTAGERKSRLEQLLDELSIKHLRRSRAFSLSGGERRRLEITRALVTEPKFMMLDEPFAGVDPIAVHDIQGIVASLKDRGIGVLISDHNVEQTLDIVDRAYIMFEGAVKVAGPVRELIFDDSVSHDYFGPTLTARLRARFTAEHEDADVAAAVSAEEPAG